MRYAAQQPCKDDGRFTDEALIPYRTGLAAALEVRLGCPAGRSAEFYLLRWCGTSPPHGVARPQFQFRHPSAHGNSARCNLLFFFFNLDLGFLICNVRIKRTQRCLSRKQHLNYIIKIYWAECERKTTSRVHRQKSDPGLIQRQGNQLGT